MPGISLGNGLLVGLGGKIYRDDEGLVADKTQGNFA
jgi:hypothetical protein